MKRLMVNGRWVSASNPPTIHEVWEIILPAKQDAMRTLRDLVDELRGIQGVMLSILALLSEHDNYHDELNHDYSEENMALARNLHKRSETKKRIVQLNKMLEWYDASVRP